MRMHAGKCKGTIDKGELRFGTTVPATNYEGDVTRWKHFPGCMGASLAAAAREVKKAIAMYER